MPLTDPIAWVIIVGSFVAAMISSAFAIGGGFLILAIISNVLPITAVVPVHSALMIGTSIGRSWFFREHVHWPIVKPFVLGSLLGAPIGARVYLDLPEVLIATVIGILMLVAVWFPEVKWRPRFRHPFFYVGIGHSLLSAMFSFGGFFQPLVIRTRLSKYEVIATLAFGLLLMNLFKLAGYLLFGFDFMPYVPVIVLAILVGILGARCGKRLVHHISERRFRLAFKIIMTICAGRLLYRAWLLW